MCTVHIMLIFLLIFDLAYQGVILHAYIWNFKSSLLFLFLFNWRMLIFFIISQKKEADDCDCNVKKQFHLYKNDAFYDCGHKFCRLSQRESFGSYIYEISLHFYTSKYIYYVESYMFYIDNVPLDCIESLTHNKHCNIFPLKLITTDCFYAW